jgi:hypothetical protein
VSARATQFTDNPNSAGFSAPGWLGCRHAQTVWPLLVKGALPAYRRERWETPDGDFIDLDWVDKASVAEDISLAVTPGELLIADDLAPCVVLFHGLEGSSRSPYARSLMRAIRLRGWRGVVVHFRGCSGEPNRLPRAYHSGDAAEIHWILRRLKGLPCLQAAPLFAVGVSLGGNALLKWLAEPAAMPNENKPLKPLTAAAAVSAPFDLAAAEHALTQGANPIYARYFLRSLIPKALAKARRFPGLVDVAAIKRSRRLRDFDAAVTAPLHGYQHADDYYARASSGPVLGKIATPTLLVNAQDDPFLPCEALPRIAGLPDAVTAAFLAQGGHAGFVGGGWPGHIDWLPHHLLDYFGRHISFHPGMS